MKRFLALTLGAVLVCGSLTACGGNKNETAAESSAPAAADETASAGGFEPVEGSTVEELQSNYAELYGLYMAIKDASDKGEIELDEEKQKTLDEAAQALTQLGALTAEELAEQEAVDNANNAVLAEKAKLTELANSLGN